MMGSLIKREMQMTKMRHIEGKWCSGNWRNGLIMRGMHIHLYLTASAKVLLRIYILITCLQVTEEGSSSNS